MYASAMHLHSTCCYAANQQPTTEQKTVLNNTYDVCGRIAMALPNGCGRIIKTKWFSEA